MCIIAMIVLFYIVSYLIFISFIEYKDTKHQNKKLKENLNKFDNVIKQNLEIQKIGLIFKQVILTLKV